MEDLNENQLGKEHRYGAWGLLLWFIGAMVVYVLSLGPVDYFFGVGSPVIRAFYAPVVWMDIHVAPFGRVFDAYMSLWDKHW